MAEHWRTDMDHYAFSIKYFKLSFLLRMGMYQTIYQNFLTTIFQRSLMYESPSNR